MVQAGSSSKNIWVAASDGDLSRVRVSSIQVCLTDRKGLDRRRYDHLPSHVLMSIRSKSQC